MVGQVNINFAYSQACTQQELTQPNCHKVKRVRLWGGYPYFGVVKSVWMAIRPPDLYLEKKRGV